MSNLANWIPINSNPLTFRAGDGDVVLTHDGDKWDVEVEGDHATEVDTIEDVEVYIETHKD